MDVGIGSIIKTSLIDYPGKISSVVFFQGCNFRCGFCYNVDVVFPDRFVEPLPADDFFGFLKTRKGLIDGVVLLGGEPLLQPDIDLFAKKVKEMGFLVKLDTNGSKSEVMSRLLRHDLVDYVAMDVKAPLNYESYYKATKCSEQDFEGVRHSLRLLLRGNVDYELRTTMVPELVKLTDAADIAGQIKGAKHYVLQGFFAGAPSYIDLHFSHIRPYLRVDLEKAKKDIEALGVVDRVSVRV